MLGCLGPKPSLLALSLLPSAGCLLPPAIPRQAKGLSMGKHGAYENSPYPPPIQTLNSPVFPGIFLPNQ